jgi:multiple sugar transport system substrate-binding protein
MKIRSMMAALLAIIFMISGVAAAATEVTIWHTFTEEQESALQGFAAAFNESQDTYEVLVQSQTYQGFLDTVYNAVANGVGPNIIINYASTAADYVEDGLVVDLSKYVFDPEIGMADIFNSLPAAIQTEATGFVDGGMYALPAVTTGPILFYNKTVYDELGLSVPTTWEELAANSKAIYEAKGIAGFAADSLTDLMQTLLMQSGNGYIDIASKSVLFGTESFTAWLKWFADNVQAGYFGLNPTGDYWSNDFNAGLVASYSGSCAGDKYIFPDGFEYAVAPLPEKIDAAWYPSWNRGPIVFNKDEASNLGAYEFVKFFLQPENNAGWAKAMNALSPYGTTQASDAYKAFAAELPASLVAVQDNLDVAGALPTISGSYAIRTALQEAATMAAGGMDPAEALAACVAQSNQAMQG